MKTIKDYKQHLEDIKLLMSKYGEHQPKVMGAFEGLMNATLEDGELSRKHKELISLGIAITVRCDGCIAFHVNSCIAAGASNNEVAETIGVAMLMGGGPAVMYGVEAFEALSQFREPIY
ncbi:MAG TPA: carboxymuconolactone decarboxylase family protein [Hanamia sp.]|nr:carboxymuconolactone decarboxylase family protein [Hanamia sp.]